MKRLKIILSVCSLASGLLFTQQTAGQYEIPRSVIASGGGEMSSADYKVIGTVGQPAIGMIGSADYHGGIGFWYTVKTCTPGLLGDVNGDESVNSTDALIILSYDAGLPLPQPFLDRIAIGFGDVTIDDLTNSTDALVVLTWEIGFPVPYPVGTQVCLPAAPAPAPGARLAKEGSRISVSAAPAAGQIFSGQKLEVPVIVNLADSPYKLGSYTATLEWDPAILQLEKYTGGTTAGFSDPVVNDAGAGNGKLRLAHAYPYGAGGAVNILNLQFTVIGKAGSDIRVSLSFSALAAAESFADLLPGLQIADQNAPLMVEALPEAFGIENYPNPFNPVTHIRYALPVPAKVKIEVFNLLGQRVITLVNEPKPAGYHVVDFDASQLASGMYYYRFQAGDPSAGLGQRFQQVNKMLLVK
ncbi:MAG: T9SS type A sorting domain-containing protein [Calditrichaceae bacterium]|nr:T9SS type A sorting domain-containing protein [Calditrichia bacterium]NUQ41146.1 T9SS type A sorting domain-containing protein [Calditrichaceae bacterium]